MPTPHRTRVTLALAAMVGLASVPAYAETNAAAPAMGARVSAVAGDGAKLDARTGPDALIDNNVHSRMVVSNAPYTITLELFQPLPVDRIAFSASDYQKETVAKDIEITLDDGTTIKHTLERTFGAKRKPAWQEIKLDGKTTRTIKIHVASVYPGETANDKQINWGGIGEIAVYTPEDLSAKFDVAGYQAQGRTFVNMPSVKADPTPVPVKLPPQAKDNVYPRTVITPEELAELKPKIMASEAGKKAYDVLIANAEGALKKEITFPDPKGPLSQLKDRNDATMKAHDALSRAAGNLGRAYLFSGEKKYADKCAQILTGYAKIYHEYPEHKGVNGSDTGKISAQRLSEAMWAIPQIIAYDCIHDTLGEDDRQLIEAGLIRPVIEFIWRKSPAEIAQANTRKNPDWRTTAPPVNRKPTGNWLNFYNTATMLAGAVLNDRDYMDVAAANFRALVRNGIGEDGMWGEGAVGYQYFAMAAMVPGFETAARHGYDLYSFDENRFKLLFDTPRLYAYPDGTMPGINDSGRVKGAGWQMIVVDYAYARYGDPRYAGVINETGRQLHFSTGIYAPTIIYDQLPEPASISYPSTVFTGLGYAIARTDNIYALMDYGPHGGTHGHFDKLNFILYANGDELGGEPKFHRYEDPLHGQWTKHSLGHNTMAVDERSQMSCQGRLLSFDAASPVKVIRAQAAGAFPGAVLDRTLVIAGDAVLDVYSGRSTFDRTFDRTLRFAGKLDQFKDAGSATPLGQRDGFQHFKVAHRAPAAEGWTGVWTIDKGPLAVTVAAAPGQEIIVGEDPDQAQMAVLRQKGARADVGVVYRPGQTTPIAARMLDTGSADVVAMQTGDDKTGGLLLISHKPGVWTALDIESDAQVVYLRRDNGAVAEAVLTGGTFVKAGAAELRTGQPGNLYGVGEGASLKLVNAWTPPPEEPQPAAAARKTKKAK